MGDAKFNEINTWVTLNVIKVVSGLCCVLQKLRLGDGICIENNTWVTLNVKKVHAGVTLNVLYLPKNCSWVMLNFLNLWKKSLRLLQVEYRGRQKS